jgi:hypothetical protein
MISVDKNNYLLWDFPSYITLQFEYYVETHKSTMKQIPSDLKARYSSMLVQRGVPEKYHYYYGKWLRYYLDFCEKYRFNQLNKENLVHFIKKLKDKKQTDQQQKQAIHSISLYYELESNNFGKNGVLKDKSKKISTKKSLELTNANWVPVYSDLTAEIKLRHYSISSQFTWNPKVSGLPWHEQRLVGLIQFIS